jgi:L-fucose mutarotase
MLAAPGQGESTMLKGKLIHPEILESLGTAGHGSRVLIADGNYPFATTLGPNADLVSLNLSPGLVNCTQVLEAIAGAVPIEAAAVMQTLTEGPYAMREDPPIWAEFRRILAGAGYEGELEQIERFDFYEAAAEEDVALTIATGEQRIYANLLLTIGVVMEDESANP